MGTIATTVTLIALGFVALGLFTSMAGFLIGAGLAAVVGIGAAVFVEPAHAKRNAAVVVGYIAWLVVAYLLVGQLTGRLALPRARGAAGNGFSAALAALISREMFWASDCCS